MPDIRSSGLPTLDPEREVDDAWPVAPAEPSRAFAQPSPRPEPPPSQGPGARHGPAAHIALAAEALPDPDDPAFGRLFDRFGDGRVVLLGEATHGTSEFYRARAAITRWLIEKRGFNILALEADWPDARVLDARARGAKRPPAAALSPDQNVMWRNAEFDTFLTWLTAHNSGRPKGAQTAIYGLDRYNLTGSMRMAVDHLAKADPEAADAARERFGCLAPWAQDPDSRGRMAVSGRYAASEAAVTSRLADALARQLQETAGGDEALLSAANTARLIREAPAHYRAMYYGGAEAWNLRARHMAETLQGVLDDKGRDAKVVVWAHNAHVGDARATEMGSVRDALSLGQLCRETWADEVRLIGMGCHSGEVACASAWDGPLEVTPLRPSLPESQERDAHDAGVGRFLLDLRPQVNSALRRALSEPRLERFVGAVYRSETERLSHYAACRLPEQFDAWVWFDETRAVSPLPDVA